MDRAVHVGWMNTVCLLLITREDEAEEDKARGEKEKEE